VGTPARPWSTVQTSGPKKWDKGRRIKRRILHLQKGTTKTEKKGQLLEQNNIPKKTKEKIGKMYNVGATVHRKLKKKNQSK